MQIILMEKVVNLGNLGDEVKVKDGYARNYLIPQGKAKRATEANRKMFEAKRAELEAAQQARLAEAFECPDLAGPIADGLIVAVTRLSLPETAARLDIVERDLSAKLGMHVDSSAFEKAPGMSVADLLGKAATVLQGTAAL